MKNTIAICAVALAFAGSIYAAETNTPAAPTNTPPVRRNAPAPVISPEVGPDRQVTLRLRAPKASEVSVSGQFGKANMTKDTNGLWSVTMGPIEPGVYEYSFNVDGLTMIDPGNTAIKPMREPRTSILHIPGQPPLIHDFQDVPHGVVSQYTYNSKVLGRLRELAVYTPPGYDQNPAQKYPILYLQHGSGDNQATWVAHGKAHWILDNLIAQNKAVPMVVVMMDGHAAVGKSAWESNTQAFEQDLMKEVMPMVESRYRVKAEAANRGIVGLSMGGGQSLTIGLNHTDLFSWVGGFSASVPNATNITSALASPEVTNQKLRLLWIGCGQKDFLLKRNEDFIALLKEKNIKHDWHLTEGDHSWPIWRKYLADFLPLVFQAK
jgi:enterochelin esterase family protein